MCRTVFFSVAVVYTRFGVQNTPAAFGKIWLNIFPLEFYWGALTLFFVNGILSALYKLPSRA